ncbi:hypothetical protein [Streptomyces violaceusniger]|uniref:hypothetical protein n=1 Tax=Streptomyces violaceusniger TaxID=68280 RepID=UPI00380EA4E7
MTGPLSQPTIQRLAFVRFLHEQGIAQSAQPEPLSASAVLSFHDAVEHFLLLSADHFGVNLPSNMKFLEYWEKLKPKLPTGQELPSKQALNRLNKLRVDLKHHGNIPSSQAIAQAKADVTTFFTDATLMIFEVDFRTVDMTHLVTRPETVRLLHEAQTHADLADTVSALAGLVLTFEELLEYYTARIHASWGRSPFAFGNRVPSFRPTREERNTPTSRHIKALTETSSKLQQAMRVIALGIDYTRYAQFNAMTPAVNHYADGKVTFSVTEWHESLADDDYQFARIFVIESALQAARVDAVFARLDDHLGGVQDGFGIEVQEWTWNGPAKSHG